MVLHPLANHAELLADLLERFERVEAGQRLLVLEAMKTEQVLRAPFAGVVARLNTQEGDLVQEGAVLIVIEESLDSSADIRKPPP